MFVCYTFNFWLVVGFSVVFAFDLCSEVMVLGSVLVAGVGVLMVLILGVYLLYGCGCWFFFV